MKYISNKFAKVFAILLISLSLVLPNAYAEDGRNLGDIFTSLEVRIKDNKVDSEILNEIDHDVQFQIEFGWALSNELSPELKNGDYAMMQLPNNLKKVEGKNSGTLEFEGIDVGTFEIIEEEGKSFLKIVFNDVLENSIDREGKVGFLMEFKEEALKDDANQNIDFGEAYDDFNFIVNPKGDVHDLKKNGIPNEWVNTDYIEWTIDVNTKLEQLEDAKVSDIIPDGLKLIAGSFEVHELKVGINVDEDSGLTLGDKVEELDVDLKDDEFTLNLGKTRKAYRITYKTDIIGDLKESYTNNAVLTDSEKEKASQTVTIDGLKDGNSIVKEGSKVDGKDEIVWDIYVNQDLNDLTNAEVRDNLPTGLVLDSIKIYDLILDGSDWKPNGDPGVHTGGFPVNLGDISSAKLIKVYTTIDYGVFNEYTDILNFENTAELFISGDKVNDSFAEVPVERGSLIGKRGQEVTDYDDYHPIFGWAIDINVAKHHMTGATFKDKIGEGLELIKDSIEVFDYNDNKVPNDQYEVTYTSDGFEVKFKNKIDNKYTVTYKTKVTEEKLKYQNQYQLTYDSQGSTGVGTGGETKWETVDISQTIKNTYEKSKQTTKVEINGTTYEGIDYSDQTMSWVISIDAKKEKINNLTIEDTFGYGPKESFVEKPIMKLVASTLNIVNGDGDLLELGESKDYIIENNDVNGFNIVFNKTLEKDVYKIYYKTTFHPNEILPDGEISVSKDYYNKAYFKGSTINHLGEEVTLEETKYDFQSVTQDYVNQGVKQGTLNREERKIDWRILINSNGRKLDGKFTFSDNLEFGDQKINQDLVLRKFTYNKAGTPIYIPDNATESIIDPSTYEIEYTDTGFTVVFENGIDFAIEAKFSSRIEGVSVEKYKNTATTQFKEEPIKTYPKEITYPNHSNFITKEPTNLDNGKIYTDDELNWKITLNESLSDFNDAVFTDEISKGLVLIEDSIKVYKGSISESNLIDNLTPNITSKTNTYGVPYTELEIELGKIEPVRYYITYTTIVTASTGEKVSNKAFLEGSDNIDKNTGDKTYTATQASWGTGTGKHKSNLIINKIKELEDGTNVNITNNIEPAEFNIYYILNNDDSERYLLAGSPFKTDANGQVILEKIPHRTYIIEEHKAPKGFIASTETKIQESWIKDEDENPVDFVNVKEMFKKIEVEKEWVHGNPNNRPNITFALQRSIAGSIPILLDETIVELKANDTSTHEWKYAWSGLENTDDQGKDYIYTVVELDKDGKVLVEGNQISTNDGSYIVSYNQTDGKSLVKNTYKTVKIDKSATKTWINGPGEKPVAFFKLVRTTTPGLKIQDYATIAEVIEKFEVIESTKTEVSSSANKTVTWNVDERNQLGELYYYSVIEVDDSGELFSHDRYITNTVNGLDYTNTYDIEKIPLAARKVWEGGNDLTRPTIMLALARKLPGGQFTTLNNTKKTLVHNGDNEITVNWDEQEKTNEYGVEYEYKVVELDNEGNELTGNSIDIKEGKYKVIYDENGRVVTNKYIPNIISKEASKKWLGGSTLTKPNVNFKLVRTTNKDAELDQYEQALDMESKPTVLKSVSGNNEVTVEWDNLPERDQNGNLYYYGVQEVNNDGSPFKNDNYVPETENNLDYTNTYLSSTFSIDGTKVWEDGNDLTRPIITLALARRIDGGEFKVIEKTKTTLIHDGKNTINVTWDDLDETDFDGYTYEYKVVELDENGNALVNNEIKIPEGKYEVIYDENARLITNKYIPSLISKSATKEWIGGGALEYPYVEFMLVRTTDKDADLKDYLEVEDADRKFVSGNIETTVNWTDLPEYDEDGNLYYYGVHEIDEDENLFIHDNYDSKTVNNLDYTNTYVSPLVEITATKTWLNGKDFEGQPVVYFQLYRSVSKATDEKVGDPVKVEGTEVGKEHLVEFGLQKERDDEGNIYTYKVLELDKDGNPFVHVNYEIVVDPEYPLDITNEFVQTQIELTVEKLWVNGSKDRDSIDVQLYKDGKEFGKPVTLNGKEETQWTHTFKDLDEYDLDGKKHVYTVDEVNVPENYEKDVDGLKITNTYVIPKTSVTVTKIWTNGPELKPDVYLQLLQNGLPYGGIVTLKSGTYEYEFTDLDKTDEHGNLHVYTVKEINVPENYLALEDGLRIENIYYSALGDITVEKVWVKAPLRKPTVEIQLYRNGEAYGKPITLNNGTTKYTWTNLELTDEKGNEYVYTVDEVKVPEGYIKSVDGLVITNTYTQSDGAGLIPAGITSLTGLAYGLIISSGFIFFLNRKRKED